MRPRPEGIRSEKNGWVSWSISGAYHRNHREGAPPGCPLPAPAGLYSGQGADNGLENRDDDGKE